MPSGKAFVMRAETSSSASGGSVTSCSRAFVPREGPYRDGDLNLCIPRVDSIQL